MRKQEDNGPRYTIGDVVHFDVVTPFGWPKRGLGFPGAILIGVTFKPHHHLFAVVSTGKVPCHE